MTTTSVLLAFAAGLSVGFTFGHFFERWEFVRRGYRLPKRRDE